MDHVRAPRWLAERAPGYCELSDVERAAIADFSIMWSLFEAQCLSTRASERSIEEYVRPLCAKGLLSDFDASPFLKYFQNRYVNQGQLNETYRGLKLRDSDLSRLVEAVLLGSDSHSGHVVTALLVIAYRLRNNLFHGVKWAYGIAGQMDNFLYASSLLASVMDLETEPR